MPSAAPVQVTPHGVAFQDEVRAIIPRGSRLEMCVMDARALRLVAIDVEPSPDPAH